MADKQYLICDCVGSANLEVLTEANDNGAPGLVIRGKFQEAEAQNKNRRVYPESVLKPQIEALSQICNSNGLIGELDHPQDSIIHFENASHMITKLWWDGNCVMGEARVLGTPAGKILEALIKEGVQIGISSRGVGSGSMNREGITIINDGFKLITFDIVADPSTPGAYLAQTNETSIQTEEPKNEEREGVEAVVEITKETKEESTTNRVDSVLKPELVEGYLRMIFESQKNK